MAKTISLDNLTAYHNKLKEKIITPINNSITTINTNISNLTTRVTKLEGQLNGLTFSIVEV